MAFLFFNLKNIFDTNLFVFDIGFNYRVFLVLDLNFILKVHNFLFSVFSMSISLLYFMSLLSTTAYSVWLSFLYLFLFYCFVSDLFNYHFDTFYVSFHVDVNFLMYESTCSLFKYIYKLLFSFDFVLLYFIKFIIFLCFNCRCNVVAICSYCVQRKEIKIVTVHYSQHSDILFL